jgi:light-regulated signal transduction histidine kinase (bacteriophytochrome)
LELLRQDAAATLSARSLGYLATITAAAVQMGTLIDDLLAFSRVGRTPMNIGTFALAPLVEEVVSDAVAAAPDRAITWTLHPLPTAHADRALLRMALVNLIGNAIKFTSGTAHATIEVGCTDDAVRGPAIFVRDNGAGFDPRYASKLFGVFQRLHSQSEFEGTGIGLANVQRIIHRHHGEVWAVGTVNGGATFSFSLPAVEASA